MKREIKFRAWATEENEMCNWDDMISGYTNSWCYDNEFWKLMQYTGLKDKNGVEIYENDIVPNGKHKTSIVKWSDSNAMWVLTTHTGAEQGGLFEYGTLEVIGNIFQHPERLTT